MCVTAACRDRLEKLTYTPDPAITRTCQAAWLPWAIRISEVSRWVRVRGRVIVRVKVRVRVRVRDRDRVSPRSRAALAGGGWRSLRCISREI